MSQEKKSHWKSLAQMLGTAGPDDSATTLVPSPAPTTPVPAPTGPSRTEPKVEPKVVSAANPPPIPAKAVPLAAPPRKQSHWGKLAGVLGLGGAAPVPEPEVEPEPISFSEPIPDPLREIFVPTMPLSEPAELAASHWDSPESDEFVDPLEMRTERFVDEVADAERIDGIEDTVLGTETESKNEARRRRRRRRGGRGRRRRTEEGIVAPRRDAESALAEEIDTPLADEAVADADAPIVESEVSDSMPSIGDSAEDETRRRRRRRRGRRGRGRSEERNEDRGDARSTEPTEVSGEDRPDERAEEGSDERPTERAAEPNAPEPRGRRNERRGGRSGRPDHGSRRGESRPTVSAATSKRAAEDDDTFEEEDTVESLMRDDDVHDEGESGEEIHLSHKKIPSWQEAIDVVVQTNMTARANHPGGGGSGGGRGGRGRGGRDRR